MHFIWDGTAPCQGERPPHGTVTKQNGHRLGVNGAADCISAVGATVGTNICFQVRARIAVMLRKEISVLGFQQRKTKEEKARSMAWR